MRAPDQVQAPADSGELTPAVAVSARRVVRGWGRATGSLSTVTHPEGDAGWRAQLADAGPRGLIARGGGCAYGDAAQNAGGVVALTESPLGQVRVAGDSSVVVDAGVTLGALVRALTPQGWTLPVLPGTGRVTVGGAIAADVHGKNHLAHGTIGAQVREMSVLTPGLGSMTMGPHSNPDAFWTTVGGLGLTGVIRSARLAVIPLESWLMWCTDTIAEDLSAVLSGLRAVTAEPSAHVVAWVDSRRRGRQLGGGIISRADPVLPSREASLELGPGMRRLPGLPALPGPGIGWAPAVAAANRSRLFTARRHPRRVRTLPQALFPLDAVPGWPRLHGRRGLVQYQFVVPFGAENVLAAALTGPQRAGRPATLAVLKIFGAGNPAPLSFPQPGWSLALDFPADPALAPVLDDLDAQVAAAGGRVYLAKDSRLRPDLLAAMYPGLPRWQAERAVLDPDRVMASDLGRRLRLTDVIGGSRG